MRASKSNPALHRARSALAQGDFIVAERLCRQMLARDANDEDARACLGLALALSGQSDAAIEQWQQVLQARPRDFSTLVNLGVALAQHGDHAAAIVQLQTALTIDATQAQVHYNLGNSLLATHDVEAAIHSLRNAIALDERLAPARNNLGVAYRRSGRLAEARDQFAVAVALDPSFADAHSNLGHALHAMGDLPAASLSLARALTLDRHCTDAALTLGQTLDRLGRSAESVNALAAAAEANPDAAAIHYALAVGLHRSGQLTEALGAYDRTLALMPQAAEAWRDRGRALESLHRLDAALASYQRAAELSPDDMSAVAGILSCSVRCCVWKPVAGTLQRLRDSDAGMTAVHPFLALSITEVPAEQQLISAARACASLHAPATATHPVAVHGGRMRIAYVSSDLRDHAIAHLLIGVLEQHDPERYEVHAVALQADSGQSEMGARLRGAVQHYHDVAAVSDADVARRMRDLGIDVAVDLNGYTTGSRPGIFAQRAAPVQVSYLGYAGTTGAPYMDYIIADEVVIPAGQERWYSEQVVRLPHCYLPNDDRRAIDPAPSRAQAGLPEQGLVLCAFGNAYKINPPVFDIWMRLLRERPGSVLWLREMGPQACENLVREAHSRGVAPERLVFAPPVPGMAQHLGRKRLADLYLDTFPYNAHSTACDALWAGVPVLTCAGASFASRVAASALTAVGLPELITHSLPEYESRALALTAQPEALLRLRARLEDNRSSAPLFDTQGYTRALEHAYQQMHQRRLRGQSPLGFAVEPAATIVS